MFPSEVQTQAFFLLTPLTSQHKRLLPPLLAHKLSGSGEWQYKVKMQLSLSGRVPWKYDWTQDQ